MGHYVLGMLKGLWGMELQKQTQMFIFTILNYILMFAETFKFYLSSCMNILIAFYFRRLPCKDYFCFSMVAEYSERNFPNFLSFPTSKS